MEEGFYWFNVQIMNRADSYNVAAYAAYISGKEVYCEDERFGKRLYRFKNKRKEVVAQWRMAPEGSPDWVYDQTQLWNAVMKKESRKDARLGHNMIATIPKELGKEDYRELVESFGRALVEEVGVVCDIAIHDKEDGKPHAHIMTPLRRIIDGEWGGRASDILAPRHLYYLRAKWEDKVNEALAKKGLQVFVNARRRAKRAYMKERKPKH